MVKKKSGTASSSTRPTSARLLEHNRPLDPKTDDVDVRTPAQRTFETAAAQVGPENVEPPRQPELLAAPEQAARPVSVQNGRMLATYVGLGLERNKDNEPLIHLDFSFPLEEVHDGFIPKKVREAWLWLKDSGNTLVQVNGLPAVTLDVYLDPKEKKPELHLVGAEFTKAIVRVVEEVGKGQAKLVTRFSFRLRVERTKDVIGFAAWQDANAFWVKMPETQTRIA